MADFEVTIDVDASAEEAWERVGAFGDLSHVQRDITSEGEGEGATRTIPTPQGDLVERCVEAGERHYEYVIDDSPTPMEGYRARFEAIPAGDEACTLRWSGTVQPPDGVDTTDFIPAFEQSLRGMIEQLKAAAEG